MKPYIRLVSVIIIALSSILWTSLFSAEEDSDTTDILIDSLNVEQELDSIFYSADSVRYISQNEVIVLEGSAEAKYHTSVIQADTISIDLKAEQAFSTGESMLKDGNQFLLGNEIYYDVNSQWGIIENGASQFEQGYYYGKEIRKVDQEIFDVDEALFTTCSSLHPHFYIKTNKLRLYRSDKIVAKPVVFYVNKFPVFAIPFGTFTIKRG